MAKKNATMRDICNLYGIPHEGRSQIYIMCPDPACSGHNPNKKKLSIDFTRNQFRCNVCEESGGTGKLMEFMTTQKPVPRNFKASKGMAKLYKALDNNDMLVIDYDESQFPEELPIADGKTRHKAYSALINRTQLNMDHLKAMMYNRGFSPEALKRLQYRSAPKTNMECNDLARSIRWDDGMVLEGVPGFFEIGNDDSKEWTMAKSFYGGVMIPVRDLYGNVQGFQIRQDVPGGSEYKEVPKFVWLSSNNKESGTGARTFAHFTGYPEYSVFLTEGPLKADLIREFTGWSGVAVPGVKSIQYAMEMFDELKEYGVREVKVAYDIDWKTNHHVEEGLFNIYLLLREKGFKVYMLDWDESEKGLDDYLFAVSKGKLKNNISNYEGLISRSFNDFEGTMETLELIHKLGVKDLAIVSQVDTMTEDAKNFYKQLAVAFMKLGFKVKIVREGSDSYNDYDLYFSYNDENKPTLSFKTTI